MARLTEIVKEANKVASKERVDVLIDYYRGDSDTSNSNAASSVSSLFYDIGPSPDSRSLPFVKLKPLVAHFWRTELEQYFATLTGKEFEYEDLYAQLLRGGSVGDVRLPERTLLPTTSQEHTSELIRGMTNEGQFVVVAFPNYPVLDFVTSLCNWINAKVGDSTPTVSSGAFVTLLLNLDLVERQRWRSTYEPPNPKP